MQTGDGAIYHDYFHFFSAPPRLPLILDERSSRYFNNARVTVTAGKQYNITCVSFGARPPVVISWEFPDDMNVVVGRQFDVVNYNSYMSEKLATITPSRNDQGKSLLCETSHPELVYNQYRSIYLNVQGRDVL